MQFIFSGIGTLQYLLRVFLLLINMKILILKCKYKIWRINQIGVPCCLLIFKDDVVVSKHVEFVLFQDVTSYEVWASTQSILVYSIRNLRNRDCCEIWIFLTIKCCLWLYFTVWLLNRTGCSVKVILLDNQRNKINSVKTQRCTIYTIHYTVFNSCKWPTWHTFLFSICLFQFSSYFEQPRAHHQENQLYQYKICYVSFCVGDRLVCRSFRTCILDGQSDTYQMLYKYNWFSWWWARGCSKNVENWNKHIEKGTMRQVGHLQELYRDGSTVYRT
jgi:hypothetical protein